MRREYFDLHVSNTDWVSAEDEPRKPTIVIAFEGPREVLETRLAGTDEGLVEASETDVNYRFHADGPAGDGVLSVTNRITGDFVLELNATADGVLEFIRAARAYGERAADGDGRYQLVVRFEDEELLAHEKSTFLVYNHEGNLVRQHSLIPGGVEL
ncbi:DUF5793 family protein [Halococcus hamelinensis]|uniref:Uncharacterized protein n=1 Tax=Halococcus hamelinensis 100A6 TaxID=1132509 RepID=M0LWZ3_9EURY|nr:DUF5793 family protein [Halococcus hamelinensis]EMA37976.1 hypothetical protein C447_11085 [Halococcus hamelinensis 100A6]